MPSSRCAPRPGLLVTLMLPIALALAGVALAAGCATQEPPPRARTAALAHRGGSSPRAVAGGSTGAASASSTSMGDSALEPAAADAAKSEDWSRAEGLYRELARRQPRNAAAKHGLGRALLRQDKSAEAIPVLEESLRLADDAGTRLDLAAAFGSVNRYPTALPHLRKAVQLAPRNPATSASLAAALVKVEKPDSAAEVLIDARKTCPGCADHEEWNRAADETGQALADKADKLQAGGDKTGARKAAEAALALRPELARAQLVLGKVARAEGDNKAAASAFRKAVNASPDAKAEPGAGARLELATLLIREGDGAEAIKLAEQVVAARGDDGAALDTLGRACDVTKNVDCARKAYGRLAKLPARDGESKEAVDHARLRMKELKSRRR